MWLQTSWPCFRDGFGAIDIRCAQFPVMKNVPCTMRAFQSRNQVLEAFRVSARIKGSAICELPRGPRSISVEVLAALLVSKIASTALRRIRATTIKEAFTGDNQRAQ